MNDSRSTDLNLSALYLLGMSHVPEGPGSETPEPDSQLSFGCQVLMDQLRIERLHVGQTIAWFKRIERSDFEGETGAAHLSDLQWLTPRVLAHEAVVSKLSEHLPFYPARFGCLFSREATLAMFVEANQASLADYFELVSGRREWGIKFYGDSERMALSLAQAEIAAEASAVGGSLPTGTNYLKLKHLQRKLKCVAADQLRTVCHEALLELAERYVNLVERPVVISLASSGGEQAPLVNLALLLTGPESIELPQWIAEWNDNQADSLSARAELSGPWPAYSFCPSLTEQGDHQDSVCPEERCSAKAKSA